MLVEGVGRHFHGDAVGAGVAQGEQRFLQGNRVRRGVPGAVLVALEADAQGADQTAGVAQGIERVTQEPGDAGFAVGAGDADHLQAASGLAEVARRQHADLAAQCRHGDAHRAVVRMHGEGVALFHHHGGAGADRRVDELAAVRVVAGHRQEQVTGGHRAAVQAQRLDGQVAQPFRQRLVGEQMPQCDHVASSPSSLPAIRPSVLSGGTCRVRRTPPTMAENTGAATRPP